MRFRAKHYNNTSLPATAGCTELRTHLWLSLKVRQDKGMSRQARIFPAGEDDGFKGHT